MITQIKPVARVIAIEGTAGARLSTYVTQITPESLESLLGHDPRSANWKNLRKELREIYKNMQRATVKARIDAVLQYLQDRFGSKPTAVGVIPPLTVAFQNHCAFKPLLDNDGEKTGSGWLEIDLDSRNFRLMSDGLGRASAVWALCDLRSDEMLSQDARSELDHVLANFTLPLFCISPTDPQKPLTKGEMGQLFYDQNYTQVAIPAKIAISLDQSDPHIRMAKNLGSECPAITSNGGVEERSATLGSKSTALVAQPVFLRFIRGALEGAKYQASFKSGGNNLSDDNFRRYQDKLCEFLSVFAEAMGPKFSSDRTSLHLTSPGWQVLGLTFHECYVKNNGDIRKLAKALGNLNWSRSSDLWTCFEKDPNTGMVILQGAGLTNKFAMLKIVAEKVGLPIEV